MDYGDILTDVTSKDITELLGSMPHLQELDMTLYVDRDATGAALPGSSLLALQASPDLKRLSLKMLTLTGTNLAALHQVESLAIRLWHGGEELVGLAELQQLPRLAELTVSHPSIPHHLITLAGFQGLTSLDITGGSQLPILVDHESTAFLRPLAHNLRSLALGLPTMQTPEGMWRAGDLGHIQPFTRLEVLRLQGVTVLPGDSKGMQGLQSLTQLLHLDLMSIPLDEADLERLVLLTRLQHLGLQDCMGQPHSHTFLDDIQLMRSLRRLEELRSLTSLDLSGIMDWNNIRLQHLPALGLLEPRLAVLKLERTPVMNQLKGMCSLRSLREWEAALPLLCKSPQYRDSPEAITIPLISQPIAEANRSLPILMPGNTSR